MPTNNTEMVPEITTALTIRSGSLVEGDSEEKELLRIRASCEQAEAKLESTKVRIEAFNRHVKIKYSNLFNRISDINDELRAIKKAQSPPSSDEGSEDDAVNDNDVNNASPKQAEDNVIPLDTKKPNHTGKLTVKALFRRISQVCHPDKTDDPKLHKIFLEAKRAYERDDLDELSSIYEHLLDERPETYDTIEAKSERKTRLSLKLLALLNRVKEVENSLEYRMCVSFEDEPDRVAHSVEMHVTRQVLAMEIDLAKQKLEQYVKTTNDDPDFDPKVNIWFNG